MTVVSLLNPSSSQNSRGSFSSSRLHFFLTESLNWRSLLYFKLEVVVQGRNIKTRCFLSSFEISYIYKGTYDMVVGLGG